MLKTLQRWVGEKLETVVSRSTLDAMLQAADLSWKKSKKFLGKRNPGKRAAFVERFAGLYERLIHREVVLIYVVGTGSCMNRRARTGHCGPHHCPMLRPHS